MKEERKKTESGRRERFVTPLETRNHGPLPRRKSMMEHIISTGPSTEKNRTQQRTTTGNHYPTTGYHLREPLSAGSNKPSLVSTQNRQAMVSQIKTITPSQEKIESAPRPKVEKSPIDKWESRLSPQRVAIDVASGTRAIPSSHHRSGSRGEKPNHPTKTPL